tara:strand:- start:165 stop:329 length:165 start_codon:yes stop_codon:yes gene_type:complete
MLRRSKAQRGFKAVRRFMKKRLWILDDGWKRQRAPTIFPDHVVLIQGKNALSSP